MPDMSSDQIRDLSIKVVEGFLNEKTPLSIGLAKQASANDLNLEQIKRACEVANTVTHLKLMQLSDDRTIEYPLCKVAEVMAHICTPSGATIEKSAAVIETPSAQEFTPTEMCGQEQTIHFIKQAALNERALSDLTDKAIVVQSQLVKLASEVSKDPVWMDKMSCVDSENFAELSTLISGKPTTPRDFGGHSLFKEAQLKQVTALSELYKEAKQIVAETSKRSELCKRAEDLSTGLTKQAFMGALARGVGSAIGKTVAAPFGMATKAVTKPVIGGVKNVWNAATETSVGKALNAPKASVSTSQRLSAKAAKGAAPVAATVAADSYGHQLNGGPGFNTSGTSKDVWDALQH